MKIWAMSDLHIELTRGWDLPAPADRPDFDVLVIAGDLISRMERGVAWLRERVTGRPVIYIPGNHEFWRTDIDRTVEKARAAAEGTNVHVLQNDAVEIAGVMFIGTTLFSDFDLFRNAPIAMNAALVGMNDYKRIRKSDYKFRLRPVDVAVRHRVSRAFIASEMAKPGKRVVVTHHGPHREAVRGVGVFDNDILSAAYTSDLGGLIENEWRPDLWIYGHTHRSEDIMIGRTRVVSNPKGYGPWLPQSTSPDNAAFDPRFIVEI
jgi:Icc-related predicted phosphoesterase